MKRTVLWFLHPTERPNRGKDGRGAGAVGVSALASDVPRDIKVRKLQPSGGLIIDDVIGQQLRNQRLTYKANKYANDDDNPGIRYYHRGGEYSKNASLKEVEFVETAPPHLEHNKNIYISTPHARS